jgi:RHS repeat-associated protein
VRADEMGGAAAGAVAAGTGQPGLNGDSTALQTRLNGPRGLAPGPGGGVTVPVLDDRGQPIGTRQVGRAVLYIADTQNHLVRELIPAVPGGSEFVRTIAGDATGVPGFAGEGWPGTSARLSRPTGLAVGPDGSLYIADTGNHRVRRLMPPTNSAFLDGGLLFTVAGTGAPGYGGDGGPATQAQLSAPEAVSVGLDGSVYVADTGNHAIRRVGPDGVITTVAGTGVEGFSEDGVPAAQARLSRPRGVVAARDGTLFFSEGGAHLLRRVLVDGTLTTVAGRSPQNGSPRFGLDDDEDVPAVGALLNNPGALALGPLGSLFFADTTNDRVRRVAGDFPAPGATRFVLPAEDGREAYVFDGQGRHVQTVDGLTAATRHSFGYDSANRVVTVTDGDGNATTIERDASGAPLAIVGPYGQRSALTVDASGRLASLTTPGGALHQLVHDRDGLLTRRTDPRGGEYTFDYEPATGRLTRAADPAGGSTILARVDTPTGYQVTRTDAPGRVTTYTVEALPGGGQRRLNAFPDGTTTEALRLPDGSHRVSRSDGAVVTTRHGPDPRWGMLAPLAASIETSRGELGPTTHAAHERTVRLTDALDPLSLDSLRDTLTINGRTTTRAFDAASRTVTETTPEGRQTVTTLDALGRPNGVQAPGLSPVSLSRDGRGRLEQLSQGAGPTVRAIALGYGPDGQPGSVTDPVASTSGLQRDLDGRITAVTLADARVFGAGYDENGNLTSFTPPGRPPQSFSHTSVDLIETATLPDVGDGPATTRFAYTPDRRLARVERPDGSIATVTRDAAGRAEQVTTPDGALTYRYDPTTGRAATIIAPDGGALSLTYAGGLLTESTWRGAVQGSVQESRDGDLRVATRGVNGGPPDTFLRDRDGRLTQAGALALQRDAQSGRLVGTSLGGVTTTLARNAFGEVERESASHDGTPLLETSYTRDALGRVTLRSETVGGTTSTFEYRYDASHRLREVRRDGVPIGDYGYDENDNRTSATTTAGTVVGTYDEQDRLLQHGAASYRYTAAGVLRSRSIGAQVTGYRYDVFGGLRRVDQADGTRIDYLTDGRHRRIGKRVDGVLVQAFLYQDRLHPVAELDGASNVVSRFVYASRAQVPDYMERAGVLYRIIADHLGSPRLVVDSQSGAVAQRLDYDAWGNVTLDTNPGFQPFGFAGGLYDPDTRLVRFGVRDYDAETGRWTARDPRFLGSGANSYGYAFADPVNLVDPEGTTPNSTTTSGTASTEPWDEITEPWRPPWEEITVEDLGPVGERIRVPATDPSECPETRTSETSADRNKEPKYLPDPTPSEMLLQALIGLAAAVAAAITFFAPEVLPAVGPALAPAR